ncbi:hypothetical protein QZH41_011573, partial [Actinostola sp. cb2023]
MDDKGILRRLVAVFILFACITDKTAVSKDVQDYSPKIYTAMVNASTVVRKLDHFWRSTGFCPPDPHQDFNKFMATNDMAQNIIYIGSTPNQGIEQVRIHFLLDLVSMQEGGDGALVISFTYLDKAMALLLSNGLRPGFELMGNPSNYFTDFDDKKQIYDWRELIRSLGIHLIERYGLEEVSKWNFESWNEPFGRISFVGLKVSLQGYLNYYDACSEGLLIANPALRLGGPASGNPLKHQRSSAIFYHCYDGVNFFTGKKGVRLDFISFHIKGKGLSTNILESETVVLNQVERTFPKFAGIPVYNDEADPLVGWHKAEDWRADARYAAMVVKVIAQHQNILIPKKQMYSLLSNDNGFMNYPPSYFSQRTLLARFQMNTSHPRKVEFIKKPVLSVMGLLAMMGDQQVFAETRYLHDNHISVNDDLGIMASIVSGASNDWELAALMYNSDDTSNRTGMSVVNVNVIGIPVAKDILYVIYQIDNYHGNPYEIWRKMKSPVFPTEDQFHKLRSHQDPVRTVGPLSLPPDVDYGIVSFKLQIPLPGVALLHLCSKPLTPPQKV